jgi:hypothetical protein
MSLSLAQFENDGIEIYIDANSGESFTSVSGYARLSGRAKSTILRRLKGVADQEIKTTQIQTPGGLQGVALITEDLIAEWLPKDNPKMCKDFIKLGVRKFNYTLAKYSEPEKTKLPELPPEPNRDGLIIGIDYPDPEILKFLFRNFMAALMSQNHDAIKEATEAKHEYLKQFKKNSLEEKLLTESEQGTRSFEKFKVWQMLQCLSEPLPFDINHQFYKNGWVKKAYKSNRQYLKPDDIKRIFKDAENEGIGRFDPEINCFVPIHLMNNVILFNKALDGNLEQTS